MDDKATKIAWQVEKDLIGGDTKKFQHFQDMVKHRFRLFRKYQKSGAKEGQETRSAKVTASENPWVFLPAIFSGEGREQAGVRRINPKKDLSAFYTLLAICHDYMLLLDYEIMPIIDKKVAKIYPAFDIQECGNLFFRTDDDVNSMKDLDVAFGYVERDFGRFREVDFRDYMPIKQAIKYWSGVKIESDASSQARKKTHKDLNRALVQNPWVRTTTPPKSHRHVHAGDWMSFLRLWGKKKINIDTFDMLDYVKDAKLTEMQIRAEKLP